MIAAIPVTGGVVVLIVSGAIEAICPAPSGSATRGSPMQLALALWSSMHGLALLLIEGQLGRYDRPVDALELASAVSGLLLDGFRPR